MKWLEENFNSQEYSLWKVEFKYPEELTKGKQVPLQSLV